MDVAIIGAFGSVGRQLATQLLQQQVLPPTARLQLIGKHDGESAHEMYGLRGDLADAFVDDAPTIEVDTDPAAVDADVVVMLAGATVPRDVHARLDRAALGATNLAIYRAYADELARRDREMTVIVQSNPVELGVAVFADALGRHRVLGAGAWNDTLRFRRELAAEFDVRRPAVAAAMVGEHGSHLVPLWSKVKVRGVAPERVDDVVGRIRDGRTLADFPAEVDEHKARVLGRVAEGDVLGAFTLLQQLPPDLRAAVKPFFIHFTSGRTTETSTAHAVAEIVVALTHGERRVVAAQVALDGEWGDVHGVVGMQVVLDQHGWSGLVDMDVADDEAAALRAAAAVIGDANAAYLAG